MREAREASKATPADFPVGTAVHVGNGASRYKVVAHSGNQVKIKKEETANTNTAGGWYGAHRLTKATAAPTLDKQALRDRVATASGPTAAEAFRMKAPELQEHADKGSQTAKDELARREARRTAAGGKIGGKREGVSFNPKPEEAKKAAETQAPALPEAGTGHTGTFEELQKSHPIGAQAYVKAQGLGTIVQHHPAMHDNTAVTVDVPGHGLIKRTVDQVQVGKDIPASALAAKARRDAQQAETDRKLAETKSARVQYSEAQQKIRDDAAAEQKANREADERVAARKAETDKTLAEYHAKQEALSPAEKLRAQSREQAARGEVPAGYVSSPSDRSPTYHYITHVSTGARIGATMEGRGGGTTNYRAVYSNKGIGDWHATRAEAAQAVVTHHKTQLARAEVANQKVMTLSKKVAANTDWEANSFQHDSTPAGVEAAMKIKQSFTNGKHTVNIESLLTKEQTQGLLSDIKNVLDKANLPAEHNTTFYVPAGDKNFRQSRKGIKGGYVRLGQNTVHINPKIASGELDKSFSGDITGHFMPANRSTTGRQYTIAHELGHTLDGAHKHTRGGVTTTSNGVQIPTERPANVSQLYSKYRSAPGVEAAGGEGGLSKYGKTNIMESYAEAYAQWIHGGPGSSKVADEYAKEFGWPTPKK